MKRILPILILLCFVSAANAGLWSGGGVSTGTGSGDMTKAVYDTGDNSKCDATDQIGTLTNTKWCNTDGSVVNCTQDTPGGGTECSSSPCSLDAGTTLSGTAIMTTSTMASYSFDSSIYFQASGLNVDGTQCTAAAPVTINGGPVTSAINCADNDGSTAYGHAVMPDGWDAGTVTFELETLQTAADTNAMNSDITCMCRGAGETIDNTWGSEIAIDDAAVGGSSIVDHNTSAAVTCNGTCAAGDTLFFRWQLDAGGTTTAVATYYLLGIKMEYHRVFGD